jgi:hypothetical protein
LRHRSCPPQRRLAAPWRDALLALAGDHGARDIVAAAGELCVLLDADDPGVLRDVDRPTDLNPPACSPARRVDRSLAAAPDRRPDR